MAQGVAEDLSLPGDEAVDEQEPGHRGRRRQAHGEPPAGGQQVELPVEDEHGHQTQPEDGHGAEKHRGRRDQPVRPAPRPRRGDQAERDADEGADRNGRERQLERGRPVLPDVLDHGLPVDDGVAEVALDGVAHVVQVPGPERLVEAEARAGVGDHLGGRAAAPGGHERRIAGQVLREREHGRGNGREQHDQEGETLEQEAHVRGARRCGSGGRARRAPALRAR